MPENFWKEAPSGSETPPGQAPPSLAGCCGFTIIFDTMVSVARSFFIETFGCQMNEHDSEKIAGLLVHRGLRPVPRPELADLFLLNTCSVREKAAQKVYSRLGELKARKQSDPDFIIGVVGCVAQQEGEDMVKRVPFVDLVVGTHMYYSLGDLLEEVQGRSLAEPAQRVKTGWLPNAAPIEFATPRRRSDFRANITIMEGCNKRCSFCIVPFTRGRERNRPARAILEEARQAIQEGFVEVLLLGQTVNSYRDPTRCGYKFAQLLAELAEIEGLRRLRFTSPHPREFDDETIRVVGHKAIICNQIHLPLQAGSTRVLRKMRRQYTREGFLEIVEKFRNCGRSIRFSTDIIVGFPGETEQDFQQTLSLVETVQFESMFSFKYSARPHTESAGWPEEVPEAEKTARLMTLQRRQREIQLDLHRQHYLGRVFEVLVEGPARDGIRSCGRTASNKIVNFAGKAEPGDFVQVLITQVGPHSLVGESVPETPH